MIIPYNRQYIDKSDVKSVIKVLKSDLITQDQMLNCSKKQYQKR